MIVRVPLRRDTSANGAASQHPPSPRPGRLAELFVAETDRWFLDARPADVVARSDVTTNGAAREREAMQVLVAEDNADMGTYLCRVLSSRFSVKLARGGAEGYRKALDAPPSVVVADVMMPGMDGFTLLRRLRENPRTNELPVVLISARSDAESTTTALELGADDYITKPFGARELVARVQAALENSQRRAETAEARGRADGLRARDGELRALLNELRAVQRRVAVAADLERRRIERDLHDGVQQRLISIRLELGLVQDLLGRDLHSAGAKLAELRTAAEETLDELRDLAQGVYPSLLTSDGLGVALLAATRRMSIPVSIDAALVIRAPRSIESAAYFCCLEALQNVAKHAGPGASAAVGLSTRNGMLEFYVRDDGAGFDARDVARGRGLVNLRDRVDALGGQLNVISSPGEGTQAVGRIPLP